LSSAFQAGHAGSIPVARSAFSKADPAVGKSIANSIANSIPTLINDQAEVQGDNLYAHEQELAGPAALACASAIFGAVLGWMLQQWFARISRRRASEPESSA
jgi:hypothetical protein